MTGGIRALQKLVVSRNSSLSLPPLYGGTRTKATSLIARRSSRCKPRRRPRARVRVRATFGKKRDNIEWRVLNSTSFPREAHVFHLLLVVDAGRGQRGLL